MKRPPSFPNAEMAVALHAALGDEGALESLRKADWRCTPQQLQALLPGICEAHWERLTSGERERFRASGRRCTLQLWSLRRHAAKVVATLAAHGIPTVLLKGLALCQGPRPYRWMADFDLLVHPEHRLRAHMCLEELGYEARSPLPADFRAEHGQHYTGPDGGNCDLHWFATPECLWDGADNEFWRQSLPYELEGQVTRILNREHGLLHVCLRGFTSSSTGHWVLDAVRILRSGVIHWPHLVEEAGRRRVTLMLLASLCYLKEEFGVHELGEPVKLLQSQHTTIQDRLYCWVKGQPRGAISFLLLPWLDMHRQLQPGHCWQAVLAFPSFLARRWKLRNSTDIAKELAFRLRLRWRTRGRESDYIDGITQRQRCET